MADIKHPADDWQDEFEYGMQLEEPTRIVAHVASLIEKKLGLKEAQMIDHIPELADGSPPEIISEGVDERVIIRFYEDMLLLCTQNDIFCEVRDEQEIGTFMLDEIEELVVAFCNLVDPAHPDAKYPKYGVVD